MKLQYKKLNSTGTAFETITVDGEVSLASEFVDCTGKTICEHDILEQNGKRWIVVFQNGAFRMVKENGTDALLTLLGLMKNSNDVKIVGNTILDTENT